MRPLVPPGWRLLAVASWLAGTVILGGLAWHLHRTGNGGRLDVAVDTRAHLRLEAHHHLALVATRLGSPQGVAIGAGCLALLCLALRWWRAAVFALAAAPLAGIATELVLKPFVSAHSPGGSQLAFPSGHSTGAFALAATAIVLLLPGRGAGIASVLLRVLLGAAAVVLAGVTAVSLVVLQWHRASDVVGGAATALVVVLTVAGLVDAFAGVAARKT